MPNTHKEVQIPTVRELQAQMFLRIVQDHKNNCDGQCGLSLFLLFPLYKEIKGEGAIQDLANFI